MSDKEDLLSILDNLDKDGGLNKDYNDNILLVDGTNTFIRCFACTPTMDADGEHIGGITGFLNSLIFAIKNVKPTRVVLIFDGKGGSKKRRKMYSNYKKNRRNMTNLNRMYNFKSVEEEKKSRKWQIRQLGKILQYLPVTTIVIDHIEADDTIGYVSYYMDDSDITIMSSDKDFLQLINERICVYNPVKKETYKEDNLFEEEKLPSSNILFSRIMEGDDSDNIEGIKGIGRKRAKKLFPFLTGSERTSVDELVEYAEDHKDDSVFYERVVDNEDVLERNYKLMQLYDVNISVHNKKEIRDQIDEAISKLKVSKIRQFIVKNKMLHSVPDIDSWIERNFGYLNNLAKKSRK